MPLGAKLLEQMDDFLLWYAKQPAVCKYNPLYVDMTGEGDWHYQWAELNNGSVLRLSKEQVKNHSLLRMVSAFSCGSRSNLPALCLLACLITISQAGSSVILETATAPWKECWFSMLPAGSLWTDSD